MLVALVSIGLAIVLTAVIMLIKGLMSMGSNADDQMDGLSPYVYEEDDNE